MGFEDGGVGDRRLQNLTGSCLRKRKFQVEENGERVPGIRLPRNEACGEW